jgi:phosphate transport system substrate-binding protein
MQRRLIVPAVALVVLVPAASAQRLSGRVKIDGSSTVAPITMAASEMFEGQQSRVQVTVGISGTGGGFAKFLEEQPALRTDISDASRPIKASERELAQKRGVEFIELPIAYDGIAVVVHPSNSFCDELTIEELKRIWEPGSKITNWKDVRPGFPDLPLKLYGPGTDSGTFDSWVETVVGKARACRNDFTASEDDNVLVQGVAGDKGSLGYFGLAYFEANQDKLKLLAVAEKQGAKAIKPRLETVASGEYSPLSRPLFLYVNKEAAQRPEVKAYVEFILNNAKPIVEHPKVGYVSLGDELYTAVRKRFAEGVTGSEYADPAAGRKSLKALYVR